MSSDQYLKKMYILLLKNKNSVFYLKNFKDQFTRGDLVKLKHSSYDKDQELLSLIKNKDKTYNDKNTQSTDSNYIEKIPIVIKHIKEPRIVTDTLTSFTRPYQSFQLDVADFNFTRPSVTDPNYVLVGVDLFTQKIFTYGFKDKSKLPIQYKKLLDDIQNMRNFFHKYDPLNSKNTSIKIQTDEEFTRNNKISEYSELYNVNLFSTRINKGHANAAEQKIKLIKERMTVFMQDETQKHNGKHEVLKNITKSINDTVVLKYGISPNNLIQGLMDDPNSIAAYNFHRNEVIGKAYNRRNRMIEKQLNKRNTRLRELNINDLVLIPKGRLKKSDYPSVLDKVTTNKKPYFERNIIFKIKHIIHNNNNRLYYIEPITRIETLKKTISNERFTRDELYALKNNTM